MSMKTIAVIFGGRSTEHDVSIVTALSAIIKPLELTQKYNVVPVYITKSGDWYSHDSLKDIATFTSGNVEESLAKLKPAQFSFDNGFQLVSSGLRAKKIEVDVVFPAMHGTYGEDGSLMGMLRMANVPFVGCDMAASAVAMDKGYSKQVAESYGLDVTKYVVFTKHEFETETKSILAKIAKLKYPLFVKPAHLGSSIGLSKVDEESELQNALEVAVHYDNKVVVEEGVTDLIEVTLPIMGNDEPIPALLEQPILDEDGVFDFDTKYMQGGKKGSTGSPQEGGAKSGKGTHGAQGYSHLPAKLDKKLYAKAEKLGLDAFKATGCQGLARIDMLIDSRTEVVYFNEINPLPGSLYAHNWKKAGISGVELVEKLIDYAVERHEKSNKLSVVFETSFLKQF